eukprot:3372440-Rhodomonas_salina.2
MCLNLEPEELEREFGERTCCATAWMCSLDMRRLVWSHVIRMSESVPHVIRMSESVPRPDPEGLRCYACQYLYSKEVLRERDAVLLAWQGSDSGTSDPLPLYATT